MTNRYLPMQLRGRRFYTEQNAGNITSFTKQTISLMCTFVVILSYPPSSNTSVQFPLIPFRLSFLDFFNDLVVYKLTLPPSHISHKQVASKHFTYVINLINLLIFWSNQWLQEMGLCLKISFQQWLRNWVQKG